MKQAGRPRRDSSELEALRSEVKELRARLDVGGDLQGQGEFWERLGVLHQVTNELAQAETFDQLCRRAVELGCGKLGFDRLSLWFVTGKAGHIQGSFGTDEKGRIRDERGCVVPYTPDSPMGISLSRRTTRALVGPAQLRNHRADVIGEGTGGFASIWDGEGVIGCVSIDNLLRGEPITSATRELLNAYASALGPLCARARALEALRASEEAHRALVESADETIATVDRDGVFLFMNGVAARRLGGGPAQFIGRTMWDLFPKPQADQQMKHVREVIATGEGTVVEAPTLVAGEPRFYRTSVQSLRRGGGDATAALVMATDLTQRRQTEEALRASEERYRMLVETMNEGLGLQDASGRITYANDRAAEMLGFTREEVIGRRVIDLIDPAHRQTYLTQVARRPTEDPKPYEITWTTGDGRKVVTRISPRPMYDEKGEYIGSFAVLTDITEAKEVSERLARSELLYRTTIDGLDDPVHVVTADLRITLGNRAFLQWSRQLGLGDDMVGRTLAEACPFLTDKVIEEYRHVFQTGQAMLTEEVNVVAGQETMTETRKIPILENGSAVRVITVIRNVTEARQAEQALRQSEQQMRLILENSMDGINIAVLDLKTLKRRLVMCNDRYVEMSGRSREELMAAGDLNAMTVYYETPGELAENNRRLMKGIPYRGLASWIRPDGKENYFEWTAAPIRRGSEIYIVGIDRDVTERRRAEQHLLVLENAVRSSISAIALLNLEGALTYVNPSLVSLWGFDSAEDVLAAGAGSLWQDKEQARQIAGHIRDTGSWTGEGVAVRRDGTAMEVAVAASIVCDREGRPVCMMGSFLDISARKRAEEAMQAAHRKLAAAREEEQRRLAGELHDSVGQGLVALHLGLRSVAGEVRDDGERIAAMAGQCEALIREVRAVCRGLYPPTLESLGLCSAMKQLAGEFKAHASISVSCAPPGDTGRLSPDVEIALFRIAQEAVTNAIRHAGARRIELELTHHQGTCQLTVTDDGSGFDHDRPDEGTGLGLNMMTERVRAIGGQLHIDSQPGRTRVTARVPCRPRP
ncbi:MAG TPA: PAS domain S-box protein [Phycisphaerae bacterium]|nr:PAS domain S-box protein [Phycisphaerae bacterium]